MSITEALAGLDPQGLVAVALAVFDELNQAPLWPLADPDTLALVQELTGALARGEAARLRAIAEVDTRAAAAATGAASTSSWLTGALRERPAAAKRAVTMARALTESFPATGAALADGQIGADHAQVITRTLAALPPAVTADQRSQAEQTLLALAAQHDPLTLARLSRHLAYVLDPDGEHALAAHEASQHARRELFLSQRDDGHWDLRGQLAPIPGAQLWTVLDALGAPTPASTTGPDLRSAPQRRADALAEACEMLLATTKLPTQGGQRPTLVVTTSLEALEGRLGAPAPTLHPGGHPLSAGAVRQLACDARIIPLTLGGDSQPLDIGRARYTVPGHLRRAVQLRDNYRCAYPGCTATPRTTHHIVPWHQGGCTALDNLVSLCAHHHRWIHNGHEHHITPTPGGRPIFSFGVNPGPAP